MTLIKRVVYTFKCSDAIKWTIVKYVPLVFVKWIVIEW